MRLQYQNHEMILLWHFSGLLWHDNHESFLHWTLPRSRIDNNNGSLLFNLLTSGQQPLKSIEKPLKSMVLKSKNIKKAHMVHPHDNHDTFLHWTLNWYKIRSEPQFQGLVTVSPSVCDIYFPPSFANSASAVDGQCILSVTQGERARIALHLHA